MPKLRDDDGSERQNWEVMKALNAKLKIVIALNAETEKRWWLWMPKLRTMMALNAKLRSDDGSECQTKNSDGSERQNWKTMMALNAKTENDDGSERQTENSDGFERWCWEVITMALNVNEDVMMALNAKTGKRWLWTPTKMRWCFKCQNRNVTLNADTEKW